MPRTVFERRAYRPETEEEVARWLGPAAHDWAVGSVLWALHTWGYGLSWRGRRLVLRHNGRTVSRAQRERLILDAIRFAPTEAETRGEETA